MAEYAKVEDGVVVQVIVAEQPHIDIRDDGPWILTPYDGEVGKVSIGYIYNNQTEEFAAPE